MRRFNLYIRYHYGKKIQKIEKNVNNFFRTLDVHNPYVDLKGFRKKSKLIEEMGRLIMERVNFNMTNDASSNSFMLHKMSTIELF